MDQKEKIKFENWRTKKQAKQKKKQYSVTSMMGKINKFNLNPVFFSIIPIVLMIIGQNGTTTTTGSFWANTYVSGVFIAGITNIILFFQSWIGLLIILAIMGSVYIALWWWGRNNHWRNKLGASLAFASLVLIILRVLYGVPPLFDLKDRIIFILAVSILSGAGLGVSVRKRADLDKWEGGSIAIKFFGAFALVFISMMLISVTMFAATGEYVINQLIANSIPSQQMQQRIADVTAMRTLFGVLFSILYSFPPLVITIWTAFGVLLADSMEEASSGIFGFLSAFLYVALVWMFSLVNIDIIPTYSY